MSNLTLPAMTYESLDRVLGTASQKKLAYATTAHRTSDSIIVCHHGNRIATLTSQGVVDIEHAGWNSVTTANRCNRILLDNAPGTDYRIAIRRGILSVTMGTAHKRLYRVVIDSRDGSVVPLI